MTRVRFDPTFIEHQRWEELGGDAFIQHVAACSFVVRTLSDGIVTRARVRTLTPLVRNPLKVAERLVAGGVWEKLEDGSYRVCQCIDDLRRADGRGDEQPSAAFVTAERERVRKRKQDWSDKQKRKKAAAPPPLPRSCEVHGDGVTWNSAVDKCAACVVDDQPDASLGNGVPTNVPNGSRNHAQSSADQCSAGDGVPKSPACSDSPLAVARRNAGAAKCAHHPSTNLRRDGTCTFASCPTNATEAAS